MQTKLVILGSVIGGISALSFSTNQNILLSVSTALVASAFYLAAYFSKDKKDKQIEKIYNFTTNQEKNLPPEPLKIVILDNNEAYKTKFEGDTVEWSKLIAVITSNPFFPQKLIEVINLEGIGAFDIIDLESKKLITEAPENTADLNNRVFALAHKKVLADLSVETKAEILFRTYVKE